MLMRLSEELPDFRKQLRSLGFMQQERFIAKRDLLEEQRALVFNAEASLDIAYDPQNPLTARQQRRIRD
eukprot:1239772-Prymnesium_polylepis.1